MASWETVSMDCLLDRPVCVCVMRCLVPAAGAGLWALGTRSLGPATR